MDLFTILLAMKFCWHGSYDEGSALRTFEKCSIFFNVSTFCSPTISPGFHHRLRVSEPN
jgi:hypothetical protein